MSIPRTSARLLEYQSYWTGRVRPSAVVIWPSMVAPPIDWPIREVALYRSGRDDGGARYFRVEPA